MSKISYNITYLTKPENKMLASNITRWGASRPVSKTRALWTRTLATRRRCQLSRTTRISSSSTLNNFKILSNTNRTKPMVPQLTMVWLKTNKCVYPTSGPQPSTFPTTWRAAIPPTTLWKISQVIALSPILHLHHQTHFRVPCQIRQAWAKINNLKEINFMHKINHRRLTLPRQHWAEVVHSAVWPPKVKPVKRCYPATPLAETR